MSIFIIVIHVIVCIALIMIVLLQTGKGADMGAAFGGGSSQTLFGSTGASTFLSKATTVAAIVFMLTSLTLAYIYGKRNTESIMTNNPAAVEETAPAAESAPDTQAAPAQPAGQEKAE
jgi:preprotein translocase subunit SecG